MRYEQPVDFTGRFGRYKVILCMGSESCTAAPGRVDTNLVTRLLGEVVFINILIFFSFPVCSYFVQTPLSHWNLLLEKSSLTSLGIEIC